MMDKGLRCRNGLCLDLNQVPDDLHVRYLVIVSTEVA
jgi:hypothetical protein